jgi:tetrahydromethanopterin S-methyltransferase subunit C
MTQPQDARPEGFPFAVPTEPSAPPTTADSGTILGIIALVLSVTVAPVGLAMGIVGAALSRRRGVGNVPAVVAIVLGAVVTLVWVALIAFLVFGVAIPLLSACAEHGAGVHTLDNGSTLSCSVPG